MKDWIIQLIAAAAVAAIAEALMPEGRISSSISRVIAVMLLGFAVIPIMELLK